MYTYRAHGKGSGGDIGAFAYEDISYGALELLALSSLINIVVLLASWVVRRRRVHARARCADIFISIAGPYIYLKRAFTFPQAHAARGFSQRHARVPKD